MVGLIIFFGCVAAVGLLVAFAAAFVALHMLDGR
jgi:hypothetical protein